MAALAHLFMLEAPNANGFSAPFAYSELFDPDEWLNSNLVVAHSKSLVKRKKEGLGLCRVNSRPEKIYMWLHDFTEGKPEEDKEYW